LWLLAAIALLLPAVASQVHLISLEKSIEQIRCVLRVKVTAVERGQTHMKLEDGSKGPMTSAYITVTGDVREVLFGKCTLKQIQTRYTWIVPIKYDKKGQVVLGFSPIVSGSGLESEVEKGQGYLFSYSYPPPVAKKGELVLLYHMRQDPVASKVKFEKLFEQNLSKNAKPEPAEKK